MILTSEDHTLFEEALLARGLVKGRSLAKGKVHVYALDTRQVAVYTGEEPAAQQSVYIAAGGQLQQMHTQRAWANEVLRSQGHGKEYRVREASLSNRKIEGQLVSIESGDARVLTAVTGLDHAADIFDELEVELATPQAGQSAKDLLMGVLVKQLAQKQV